MTLPDLKNEPFRCPDCGKELRVYDTAEETANKRLWASCGCEDKQAEISDYPKFPSEWEWPD